MRVRTTVVQGPVVFIPAGATDKEAAANLLALMMSPEIVAEETYTTSSLPTSRMAARDLRFHQIHLFEVFMDLMVHPNAKPAVTTPISSELNEAPGQVVVELLHERGDPVPLLSEVQAESAPMLKEALSYHGRP